LAPSGTDFLDRLEEEEDLESPSLALLEEDEDDRCDLLLAEEDALSPLGLRLAATEAVTAADVLDSCFR
jgi:hypothetical protein